MPLKIVAGYEMPLGAKLLAIIDWFGPASYANVSTSAGAGDVLAASALGRGGIDAVLTPVAIAKSGNYAVQPYIALGGGGNAVPSIQLRWFSYPAAATTGALGAEVANATDLSAESVRLALVLV